MRQSVARLVDTAVRLSELQFPTDRVHIARTRLVFIHLDNLLHFAKADRDGRVDGLVAAYLPDALVLLLLRKGELATAVGMTEGGRLVLPIAEALDQVRAEAERSELLYADAPLEQLAWMYASCATPAMPRHVDPLHPEQLFPALRTERFAGVLELISNGRVSYLRFEGGEFARGYFAGRAPSVSVAKYIETLYEPASDGTPPRMAATVFPAADDLPMQAAPELIETYRRLFWAIVEAADAEAAGQATKHARRIRDLLSNVHQPLTAIGRPLDQEAADVVTTPEQLTYALSDWTLQLLEQVEIVAPGAAAEVLKRATHDQRYVLQKAGFYDRLPWAVAW